MDPLIAYRWAADPGTKSVPGAALIGKAFHMVDLIAAASTPITVTELAAKTGWARPTLYRILSAVVAQGYVRLDPLANGYTLGFRFLEHAQKVWASAGLAAIASVELQRLRDMTGETAYLAVPHEGEMLSLGKFEGLHAARSSARLGAAKPLHCTSQGKAVLAFLPEREAKRLLTRAPLERFTPNTIVDPDILTSQLEIIRQRGFATEDEEIVIGNRCVGAPVLDAGGRPVAAVSVAGPIWRLTPERVEQLGPEVAAIAQGIAQQLNRTMAEAMPATGEIAPHAAVQKAASYGADPVWDERAGLLRWVDRLGPCLHETTAEASRLKRPPIEAEIEAAAPCSSSLLCFREKLFCRIERSWSELMWPKDCGPISSCAVGTDERIWMSTLTETGSAIRAIDDPSRILWTIGARIRAMAWCAVANVLYAVDPDTHTIYALGQSSRARVLSRLPPVSGEPRGLAVDGQGRVWVANYGGWSVARLDPQGEIDKVLPLSVPRPTGLAFGGPDKKTMFITTARVGLSREILEKAPLSGRLLVGTL
jgi:IclR family acetate operon transcriptional repressor